MGAAGVVQGLPRPLHSVSGRWRPGQGRETRGRHQHTAGCLAVSRPGVSVRTGRAFRPSYQPSSDGSLLDKSLLLSRMDTARTADEASSLQQQARAF
jgi:hypothetical protein